MLFISNEVHNYKAFYRQNGYLLAMQVNSLTNRKIKNKFNPISYMQLLLIH